MKKILIIAILPVLLLLFSCTTQKRCLAKFPPEVVVKDSIVTNTEVRYRDTTIFIPGKTIMLTQKAPCIDFSFSKKSDDGNTTLSVNSKNGVLTATCESDSLKQVIKGLKEIISTTSKYKTITKTFNVNKPVPTPYIPLWVFGSILLNLFLIIVFIRKPLLKLIQYYIP